LNSPQSSFYHPSLKEKGLAKVGELTVSSGLWISGYKGIIDTIPKLVKILRRWPIMFQPILVDQKVGVHCKSLKMASPFVKRVVNFLGPVNWFVININNII